MDITDITQTDTASNTNRKTGKAGRNKRKGVGEGGAGIARGYAFLEARPVLVRQCQRVEIIQVGAGGTGSWLTAHLVRIARELQKAGKEVSLRLVDPDLVEEKNLTRQHFARAELGLPKAACLALRYGSVWGVEVGAVTEKFSLKLVQNQSYSGSGEKLTLVVGCVDNAAARAELAATLKLNGSTKGAVPRIWYLDCGNYKEGGQVLLGSTADPLQLKEAFSLPGVCTWLPSPALQHPELLIPLPEELAENRLSLSCAELALMEAQSLSVNFQIAAVAADYVLRLLLVGGLKKYATYLHLPTGVTRSRYTIPGELIDYYRKPDA